MNNNVENFIDWLASIGIPPNNRAIIVPDGKRHYYQIVGDKPNILKGSYWLLEHDSFSAGWAHSLRDGITHKYTGKNTKSYTPEQRAEWDAKCAAAKEANIEEDKILRLNAAQKAQSIWNDSETLETHPYAERKKISLNGARINGKNLIIPVRINNVITSVQTISPHGDKMFLAGGEISGGYFSMATAKDDLSEIFIAEGFATGCTIREIIQKPVVVAFNSGNLKSVAIAVKKKFPKSRIIICADNDWEKDKNVGLDKAMQAAAAISSATVLYPEFPEEQRGNKLTDFNDLFILSGADSVKSIFDKIYITHDIPHYEFAPLDAEPANQDIIDELPPLEAYNDDELPIIELYKDKKIANLDWRVNLIMNDEGKILKTMNNTLMFLENDPVLSNIFCYDEFCRQKIIYRCPPWENASEFKVREVRDDDITQLTLQLEKRGVVQPFATITRLLDAIIKRNSRHPAQEYFNSLVWDGVKRIDTWLHDYCGCIQDDKEYVSAIGRKWLTAAVTRIFHAGHPFEYMLILEGKQGARKSTCLKELATIGGRAFFTNTIKVSDLGQDKTVAKMNGVLIAELAELSGMGKKDVEELKADIEISVDKIVLKYQNEATEYPRQLVFAGTYNPNGNGIFSDTTGNRRFWVVKVGDKIDIDGIIAVREQLWAEATVAYREGEKLYLEKAIEEKAAIAQKERMVEHPWEGEISEFIYDKDIVFMEDVWNKLNITDRTKRTAANSAAISKIMMQKGYEKDRARQKGEKQIRWKKRGYMACPLLDF